MRNVWLVTACEKCGNDLYSLFSWFHGTGRDWIPFSKVPVNCLNQEISFQLSVSALCASSTTAATKQQTCRQSALGLQSLVLRFHILHIEWVWVGMVLARDSRALSQLIPIFRKDKCYLLEFLAVACQAGEMQSRWGDVTLARPGWCGGLGLPQSSSNLMTSACQESKRAAWEERNLLLSAGLYGAFTEHP